MARRLDIGRVVRMTTKGEFEPQNGSFARVLERDSDASFGYIVQLAPKTVTNNGKPFTGWRKNWWDRCWCVLDRHVSPTRLVVTDGRTWVRKFVGDRIRGKSLGRVVV